MGKRYAMVTPYFKEERKVLERCIHSVRTQTVPADHFVVADGFAQDWIDAEPVRHMRLDRNHADSGCTPRAIGSLLAAAERYDGIGLLDADNWLDPDHVERCIDAASRTETCDYVAAQRKICRPDGSVLDIEDEPPSEHVDTNCYFLLPGSYHVLSYFALIPQELSLIGDRMFFMAMRARNLKVETVAKKTVNYVSLWQYAYVNTPGGPPPGANRYVDIGSMREWMDARSPRERDILFRRAGSSFDIARRR